VIATLGSFALGACFDVAATVLVGAGLAWWGREICRFGESDAEYLARSRRRARYSPSPCRSPLWQRSQRKRVPPPA